MGLIGVAAFWLISRGDTEIEPKKTKEQLERARYAIELDENDDP